LYEPIHKQNRCKCIFPGYFWRMDWQTFVNETVGKGEQKYSRFSESEKKIIFFVLPETEKLC